MYDYDLTKATWHASGHGFESCAAHDYWRHAISESAPKELTLVRRLCAISARRVLGCKDL
jgi:hypothetical protein